MKFLENKELKEFFSDKQIRWASIAIGVLLLISWIYTIVSFLGIPDRIILHINSENVVDVVGTRGELYGAIGIWSIVVLASVVLAYAFYKRKEIWARALLYGTCAVTLLLLTYVWLIVSINK